MIVTMIDYGMGNLRSVAKAFEFLGATVVTAATPEPLRQAAAIVLPGVGHFGDGMRELRHRQLADPIRQAIAAGIPFLGICLGMQLLLDGSEEAPTEPGLGVFSGQVVRFPPSQLKIPHMGWNQVHNQPHGPLTAGLATGAWCYFVHSYYAVPTEPGLVQATCEYGLDFPAIIGRGRAFATQFHPEKSQAPGLQMLRNFIALATPAAERSS